MIQFFIGFIAGVWFGILLIAMFINNDKDE